MNAKLVFYAMTAFMIILGAGLPLALNRANSTLSKRAEKLVALKLDSRVLDEQQSLLVKAAKDVAKYSDLEKIAKIVVPQDKDQAKAVREIVNIAELSDVKLSVIGFSASTLGQPAATKTTVTDGTDTTSSSPTLTQVKPVENIKGVYVMEITIQQDASKSVTYDKLIDFLSRLEKNRRTAQVSTVTVQPNPGNRSLLTFNLTVNIYIKP